MDLTSMFQKPNNLPAMFALAVFAGVTTTPSHLWADDTAVVVSDDHAGSTASGGQSTLVVVESQLEPVNTGLPHVTQSQNTLRSETPATVGSQSVEQRRNLFRAERRAQPNRQIAQKLQPLQSAQPRQTVKRPMPVQPRQAQDDDQVVVADHEVVATQQSTIGPIDELLLQAHELSQQASTEQQYKTIIDQCSEAIRLGANAENRGFARQLSSWALNRRGQLRVDSGQAGLANVDFRAALEYNPNNWRALHNRGVSFAQRGQFDEAFDTFNQVIELNPNYAKVYTNRATLYLQANDLELAVKDYHRAIDRDPQLVAAQIGLGQTCHLLGKWDEAIEHLDAAMELDPSNAHIACSRGDLLADMGRYRDALSDYAHTIELNPEFAHAYRNGAWLLATCPNEEYRDTENAIIGARQALEFGYGDRHVALDTLAAALANAGQFSNAVETLHDALEIAPSDAKAAYLSRLQLYKGKRPFRTQHVRGEVEQVIYEATDR